MSRFSERITTFVEATGFSVYQIAKKAKIDRSTIHKVITGERIPSNEFYKKLVRALDLTPYEQEELDDLFKMTKVGDKVFYLRRSVKKLIEDLAANTYKKSTPPVAHSSKSFPALDRGTLVIEGKNDVNNSIIDVLNEAFYQNDSPQISLSLSFEHQFVYEFLYNAFVSTEKAVTINHFTYLEKETSKNNAVQENIHNLQYVLSFSLCGKEGYHPYYAYASADPATAVSVFRPYFISTNRHLLALSRDFKTAVLYDDPKIIELHRQDTKRLCQTLPKLTQRLESYNGIQSWFELDGMGVASIEPHPCFGTCFTDSIIESLVRPEMPEKEALIALGKSLYAPYVNGEFEQPISMFSTTGLEKFMQKGVICYFPEQIIRPCTLEERKGFLKKISHYLEGDQPRFIGIDGNKFRLPMNIEVLRTKDDTIVVQRFIKDQLILNAVCIDEPGICQAFTDFFDYLPTSDLVLKKDEVIKLFEDYINA